MEGFDGKDLHTPNGNNTTTNDQHHQLQDLSPQWATDTKDWKKEEDSLETLYDIKNN